MSPPDRWLLAFDEWYKNIPRYGNQLPARGTIAAALVVLDRLKSISALDLEAHRSKQGQSQIIGLSKRSTASILARFGETRPFLEEGGRTNRGAPGAVAQLLAALSQAGFAKASEEERQRAILILQQRLVELVREYHARQRLKLSFDPSKTVWQLVSELLALAHQDGKDGQVAQYLVGAKLECRFPDATVDNLSYSTADQQLGRSGDFLVGDTAFHVTVSPNPGHLERCQTNLRQGHRAFLLVPYSRLEGTRQNVSGTSLNERVSVEAIESFVSQNLEELAHFSSNERREHLRLLLETYNRRVDAVENDKSILVEIPENLL